MMRAQALGRDGAAALARGDAAAAAELLAKAVRAGAEDPATLVNWGTALAAAGRTDEAARVLARACARHPAFAPAHYNRALVLVTQGDRTRALAAFRRAVELAPGHAKAWHELGRLLVALGDREAATEAFARAHALVPGDCDSGHALAGLLRAEARFAEAVPVLEAMGDDPEARLALGACLAELGRLDAAEAVWAALLAERPAAQAAVFKERCAAARGRFALRRRPSPPAPGVHDGPARNDLR